MSSTLKTLGTTWLAGLLVLLPIALPLAVLAWVWSIANQFLGPSSVIGQLFAKLGLPFTRNPELQYLLGSLVVALLVYLLGLGAQRGLRGVLKQFFGGLLRRVPIVGSLYGLAERFTALLDKRESSDIGAMRPVWCFFGGDGAAVLALAPSAQPTEIAGRSYIAILVPTAPVPFGGALIYVPQAWVQPAEIGVDRLTEVYVSMGLTPPRRS